MISTQELNELIYQLGVSIRDNTTQEVFNMTRDQAELLYEQLTDEVADRVKKWLAREV